MSTRKSFFQYVREAEEARQELLLEGGGAMKRTEVVKIKQENVNPTLANLERTIFKMLKLDRTTTRLLGSTGKKKKGSYSGDIDIAVDLNHLLALSGVGTVPKLIDWLVRKIGSKVPEVVPMVGLSIVSFAFPIAGDQDGEFVQVDFMLTDDVDFAKFAYHSPTEWDSRYKGAHRGIMLHAIAFYTDFEELERKGDELISWKRSWMDNKQGLMTGIQSRMGKRKLLVNPKIVERKPVTKVPDEIMKTLLGPDFSAKDADSFESLYRAVNSPKFVNRKRSKDILEKAAAWIKSAGFPVPKELQ